MPNVTQLVPNFLGGVSRQNDIKKLPGQVKECINGYADPTFGLVKRPGFRYLDTLKQLEGYLRFDECFKNAKWFFYLRDESEAYLGCIPSRTDTPTANTIYLYNALTLEQVPVAVPLEQNGIDIKDYFESNNAREDFDVLTIQDYTVITNKTIKTSLYPNPTAWPGDWVNGIQGTVQLVIVEYGAEYTVTINDTPYTYKTIASNDPTTDTEFLDADDILTGLKDLIEAGELTSQLPN